MSILDNIYYGNSLVNWAITFAIILGAFLVGKICYWFFGNIVKKLTSKTKTKLDDIIIDMLEEPIMFAIIIAGIWYGTTRLILSPAVNSFLTKGYHFLIVLNITWLIARLVDSLFKEYVIPLTEKTESDFDDQIIPIVTKSVKGLIWSLGIIVALDNAGYKIGPILAGLGIGGLALAMAAKDTVANIFGGFTIFTDKPFKIKDRIKVDGFDGVVEEIGLRSTRLRTLSGTRVTIPNLKFSENSIENITLEPSRRVLINLGLTYDTTPNEMKKAMKLLNEIAHKNENVKEGYKVSFTSFGDFSLGILFIYNIKKTADILKTQNEMNLKILESFNKHKLNMAFPTQTIELKK